MTRGRTVLRSGASLTAAEMDDIWALYSSHVDRDRETYEPWIRGSDIVALTVEGEPSKVAAFVATSTYAAEFGGRPATAVLGRSAVAGPSQRGRATLQREIIRLWSREKRRRPSVPWFLVDTVARPSGYLSIAQFAQTWWPRRDRITPAREAEMVDAVMRRLAPDRWDAEASVLRGRGSMRFRLQPSPPTATEADRRAVADFHTLNPGTADGDLLVVLLPGTFANVGWSVVRMMRRAVRRRRRRGLSGRPPRA